MEDHAHTEQMTLAIRLRQILLELARREETLAHSEAVAAPYWSPQPPSVIGHRVAAQALRSEADRFLQAT